MGCVLLYIGLRLLYDQTPWAKRKKAKILEFEALVQERLKKVMKESGQTTGRGLPPEARFKTPVGVCDSLLHLSGRDLHLQCPALFTLALVVGIIGGTYGIGGGAIILSVSRRHLQAADVYHRRRRPPGDPVTSVAGVGIYCAMGIWPDLALGPCSGSRLRRYVYRGPPPEIYLREDHPPRPGFLDLRPGLALYRGVFPGLGPPWER